MDIRKVFGANVRRYRIAVGLTQAAVAIKMGVDRAYVSSIERGGQNATLISLLEIAQALSIHAYQLLVEDGTITDDSPKPRPAEPDGV